MKNYKKSNTPMPPLRDVDRKNGIAKRWTSYDLSKLEQLIGQGVGWEEIGHHLGRTGKACKLYAKRKGLLK